MIARLMHPSAMDPAASARLGEARRRATARACVAVPAIAGRVSKARPRSSERMSASRSAARPRADGRSRSVPSVPDGRAESLLAGDESPMAIRARPASALRRRARRDPRRLVGTMRHDELGLKICVNVQVFRRFVNVVALLPLLVLQTPVIVVISLARTGPGLANFLRADLPDWPETCRVTQQRPR